MPAGVGVDGGRSVPQQARNGPVEHSGDVLACDLPRPPSAPSRGTHRPAGPARRALPGRVLCSAFGQASADVGRVERPRVVGARHGDAVVVGEDRTSGCPVKIEEPG